jgi:hypothetical protein
MGFFDDIFGPSEIEKKVESYFIGSRTNFESFRICMRDMIARPMNNRVMGAEECNAITRALIQHGDPLVLRNFVTAAVIRCSHPLSVNLIYSDRRPTIWIDNGVKIYKPDRELRFTLLTKGGDSFAWLSLYDDRSRISPKVPGVDDVAGWTVALQG